MRDNDTLAKIVVGLPTEARTTLYDLWLHGPMLETCIGRTIAQAAIIRTGLADHVDGHVYLTAEGVRACILEFDAKTGLPS